jgi:hypothetical protein
VTRFFLTGPPVLLRPSSDRRVSFATAVYLSRSISELPCKWEGGTMGGGKSKEVVLSGQEELILKVTKEIMVKFIEIGRISTTNFEDTFKLVNNTVRQSLKS